MTEPNSEAFLEIVPETPSDEPEAFDFRLFVAATLTAALSHATIYRGQGFAGAAALCALGPLLMSLGRFRPARWLDPIVLWAMLLGLSARLVWCGSATAAAIGGVLLVAFAMTLSGLRPFVVETFVFGSHAILAGYAALTRMVRSARPPNVSVTRIGCVGVVLPVAAFLAFGLLFVLANPDLLSEFSRTLQRFVETVRDWLIAHGPRPTEVLFVGAAFWIACGLLRPLVRIDGTRDRTTAGAALRDEAAPLYPAFRNMLATVIALFAAYLMFEFRTLWFREFPKGFPYSGYAHEGAFWLTVALALATLTLSLVFRGPVLADPRRRTLHRLAALWSIENFLLAITVYHRLLIYVGFNGMTRMRTIGFFGISAVALGFVLVLVKIARRRDFAWLVRRQLLALATLVFLHSVTPVDGLSMRYNVRRILAGDPAPCVQISVHPIDAEGVVRLPPLLDCENETIRAGIRALLAARRAQAVVDAERRGKQGWTAFQLSERRMLERLDAEGDRLESRPDDDRVLRAFHEYAYQWY